GPSAGDGFGKLWPKIIQKTMNRATKAGPHQALMSWYLRLVLSSMAVSPSVGIDDVVRYPGSSCCGNPNDDRGRLSLIVLPSILSNLPKRRAAGIQGVAAT